jgi:hypothetical protein
LCFLIARKHNPQPSNVLQRRLHSNSQNSIFHESRSCVDPFWSPALWRRLRPIRLPPWHQNCHIKLIKNHKIHRLIKKWTVSHKVKIPSPDPASSIHRVANPQTSSLIRKIGIMSGFSYCVIARLIHRIKQHKMFKMYSSY